MKGISESLAGRIRILKLGSLSAAELNQTNLVKDPRDFLWRGGFPELWTENLDANDFFEDYIQPLYSMANMPCIILQCIEILMSSISFLEMVEQFEIPCNELAQKAYDRLKSLA